MNSSTKPRLEGPQAKTPSSTLIVAPNWVGDNVMAIPVLDALKATGRSLTVLAKPHLKPLIEVITAVDNVVVRSGSDRETIRLIRGLAFEEAVVLPNSFRSAWLPFRAGIPVRWGYRGDLRGFMLEPGVGRPPGLRPQLADYDALLRRVGAPIPTQAPRLSLSSQRLEQGRVVLRETGIGFEEGSRVVGVFPGAEFGPSKRWAPENFAKLLTELAGISGLQTLLIAGPGESVLAEGIQSASGVDTPVVGPELDLAELAAVLAQLDGLVTNDSGPMHIAAAVGTPCVALFGPTNPSRTAPAGNQHQVLYTNRWCSPCFRKRCPLLHQRCMRDLSVPRVVDAVADIAEITS